MSNQSQDLQRITGSLAAEAPLKWVFAGDSITMGAKHTSGWRSYSEIFSEKLRWELDRRRDVIINTGISGNTSSNVLDDFDWRIGQFDSDIVSIMIGTNDASHHKNVSVEQFKHNLQELITRIRGLGAVPILQTPNSIVAEKAPERIELPVYVQTLREVAGTNAVVLIDQWAHWEISARSDAEVPDKWLNDELHPNALGHQQLAQLIFHELSIFTE